MSLCECGCGGTAVRGSFLPGHDQRLRAALEAQVGGILALRSLVEAARSFYEGSLSDQALSQVVRGVFDEAGENGQAEQEGSSCRTEVLAAARSVLKTSGRDTFTIPEIIAYLRAAGSRYAESTIRTHIVSRMCANAPVHHAVTYRDLVRTDRGEYRLSQHAPKDDA